MFCSPFFQASYSQGQVFGNYNRIKFVQLRACILSCTPLPFRFQPLCRRQGGGARVSRRRQPTALPSRMNSDLRILIACSAAERTKNSASPALEVAFDRRRVTTSSGYYPPPLCAVSCLPECCKSVFWVQKLIFGSQRAPAAF